MSAFRMPSHFVLRVAIAVALGASLPVLASEWHSVVTGKTETIDIDKSRIARGAGGTTGWSRILLGQDVKDPGGVYNAIHAQNLYDCGGRRFTTLRRAYFNGDTLVREESVSRQRANKVQPGSIDERLLNEACGALAGVEEPGLVGSLGLALKNALDPERPSAMHADMRTLADDSRGRIAPVSDSTDQAGQPLRGGDHRPAGAGRRKAQADRPAADRQGCRRPGRRQRRDQAGGTRRSRGAGCGRQACGETRHQVGCRRGIHAAATAPESATEKRLRELQYATSGPRKTVKKKPAEEHKAANPAAQMHAHWSYEGEGAPANWGKLRSDYTTCATGQRQSPIDIRDGIKVGLETIRFDYKPTQFRIIDNGHTLQVSVGEGLALNVMGKRYELLQFHFHRPSEEKVNGKSYDMVVHLVHRNDEGQLAVVAVLLEKGSEHPLMQTLWNNMPLEKNMEVSPAEPIDLMQLLPETRSYWTYMGSLTTPPCTEGVLWMVMKQPLQVSADQVSIFSRLYRHNRATGAPQPANGRLIKESR
jgi:carbonic anhydrase